MAVVTYHLHALHVCCYCEPSVDDERRRLVEVRFIFIYVGYSYWSDQQGQECYEHNTACGYRIYGVGTRVNGVVVVVGDEETPLLYISLPTN